MNKPMQIGFSQRIRLEWMEETARLVSEGVDRKTIVHTLQALLKHQLSIGNTPVRGNREKAITILVKTWAVVPGEREALRDEGLTLLSRLPTKEHMAVHWGMSMASYPFFGTVAEATGRLLRIQGNVSAPQVQKRLREMLGERETVYRSARRVLRTFNDWGVLRDTETKGIYQPGTVLTLRDQGLLAWLVEAALHANGKMLAVSEIARSTAFFPFDVTGLVTTDLGATERLDLLRQGLDESYVSLRRN